MNVLVLSAKETPETRSLRNQLAGGGVSCVLAVFPPDAEALFTEGRPDLLIVDTVGAAKESISAILAVAHSEVYTPVIGLFPRGEAERIDVLAGWDEVFLLPSEPQEVLLRFNLLLRRLHRTPEGEVLRQGDFVMNLSTYEVWVADREVTLTFKEYELLRLLASAPGRVFSREYLLERLWGYNYFGGTRTVDVHVTRLRSKIDDATHTFIETVRNVGYRFRAQGT
ncbi:MAG: response regulator transcription factor [Chloroflexi bacterium]|nr:response regulator transcription factor [Chloroflexota bacterium]